MALNDELSFAFYEARKGNRDSLNYLVDYFIERTSRQLKNMQFDDKKYHEKVSQAYQVFFRDFNTCYEASDFIKKTLEDLKKVIYLDENLINNSSKDILNREDANVRNIILNTDLSVLNLPIVYREVARMYYVDQKTIEELVEIFKCSESLIYFRLRKVADAVLNKNKVRINYKR